MTYRPQRAQFLNLYQDERLWWRQPFVKKIKCWYLPVALPLSLARGFLTGGWVCRWILKGRAIWKKECNTSHPKAKYERLVPGMHLCEREHGVHPGRWTKTPTSNWNLWQEANLHLLCVNSSLTSTQGTEAGREAMLWNSPRFGLICPPTHSLTHSLFVTQVSTGRGGGGGLMIISISRADSGASRLCPSLSAHQLDLPSLQLPAAPPLCLTCAYHQVKKGLLLWKLCV